MEKLSNSKFNSLTKTQLELITGGKDKYITTVGCVCDTNSGTVYSEKIYQRSLWDRAVNGLSKYNRIQDDPFGCDDGCDQTRS